ncbi:hypothetical protein [Mycolicibacterium helvum]|uniref:hypothetical protein n=1 Tax=Mycolicibacterium helvum TaxID=1534349 RepID=UPI0013D41E22|nr:hypothetical protein [Mycolicibacterium helvum]
MTQVDIFGLPANIPGPIFSGQYLFTAYGEAKKRMVEGLPVQQVTDDRSLENLRVA